MRANSKRRRTGRGSTANRDGGDSVGIEISRGNFVNNHLYFTAARTLLQGIPLNAVLAIELVGLNRVIRTKRIYNRFQDRTFAREFFQYHLLKPGDFVILEQAGPRRFRLHPGPSAVPETP